MVTKFRMRDTVAGWTFRVKTYARNAHMQLYYIDGICHIGSSIWNRMYDSNAYSNDNVHKST
jgi:hypothetical protein